MNELSDQAALQYWDQITDVRPKQAALLMWQQARVRALAIIDKLIIKLEKDQTAYLKSCQQKFIEGVARQAFEFACENSHTFKNNTDAFDQWWQAFQQSLCNPITSKKVN
jgi:hypothetical protein